MLTVPEYNINAKQRANSPATRAASSTSTLSQDGLCVTASEDGTAKVWRLADGRLEGQVSAVRIKGRGATRRVGASHCPGRLRRVRCGRRRRGRLLQFVARRRLVGPEVNTTARPRRRPGLRLCLVGVRRRLRGVAA